MATQHKAPYDRDYHKEAEDRLGQCLVAFGAGAGAIRVRRNAVRSFVEALRPSFERVAENHPCWWLDPKDYLEYGGDEKEYRSHATQITDLSRAVGRLAADNATWDGRFSIEKDDVKDAFKRVKKHYQRGEMGTRGAYCTDGRSGVSPKKPKMRA